MKKPNFTIILAAVNVIVFFALTLIGPTENASFMAEHGAVYVPYVLERGEYYRIFTSMFLHFGFHHLMNNMVMLVAIGYTLEPELGSIRFLILYLLSGAAGTAVSMWQDVYMNEYAVAAGASGAIFGLIGALFYVAVRNHGRIGSVSSKGLVFMAVYSIFYGYANGGVDNVAHIGGLLSGAVLAVLLYRKRKGEFRCKPRS